MKQISILLCFRYLQHRRIVLLSIVAVALSCALLISTDSLFTGFIDAIESSTSQHLGDIILKAPSDKTITEYELLINSLCQADSIQSATAVLSSQGLLLTAPGKVRAVQAWGIELPRRLSVKPLHDEPPKTESCPDSPESRISSVVSLALAYYQNLMSKPMNII